MPLVHLPLVPRSILRRHHVHRPLDHRFRAAARLLQSIWRSNQRLSIGSYTAPSGTIYRLGSRLSERAAATGANFLSPELARLAMREAAYRAPGVFFDEHRLWTNLLSSTTLAFNLFGPLRLDLHLATKIIRGLCPDLSNVTACAVLFEHAPARRDESFTGDATALDAVIVFSRGDKSRGFLGIELKYSEAFHHPRAPLSPHLAELTKHCALYKEPDARPLTSGPLQQALREHVLLQALLEREQFTEGRFIMVAPALNRPVQRGIDTYRRFLLPDEVGRVRFGSWTLEALIEQFRLAGCADYAEKLHRRYLDWNAVDEAMEAAFAIAGRPPKAAKGVCLRSDNEPAH